MFKESNVLFLYAETSVHLGSGDSLGGIDLTIQRERYTRFPVGASAGVKGSIRAWFEQRYPSEGGSAEAAKIEPAFGPPTSNAADFGGAVSFTDARLLLFPVRSMQGVFSWVTCPTVLERFKRDLGMGGFDVAWSCPNPGEGEAFGGVDSEDHSCVANNTLLLEEFPFSYKRNSAVVQIVEWLKQHVFPQLPEYAYWKDRLPGNLIVIDDSSFGDFVQYATEVEAHIKINSETKVVDPGGLFYQENLPCDSVMYTMVLAHKDRRPEPGPESNEARYSARQLLQFICELSGKRVQMGGSESTGKGIFCVNAYDKLEGV